MRPPKAVATSEGDDASGALYTLIGAFVVAAVVGLSMLGADKSGAPTTATEPVWPPSSPSSPRSSTAPATSPEGCCRAACPRWRWCGEPR